MNEMKDETVLVTGGSGYIASFCIMQLLEAGYRVKTTVRSLKREPEVRAMLKRAEVDVGDRLSFAEADLLADDGWAQAAAGCRYMLHVASPLQIHEPKDPDELIRPAIEGTLRALRAARDAGVRRVVLTSSFAAIGYGHQPPVAIVDEANWTNVEREKSAYIRSKALAERAAWDFIEREGQGLELAVVNPVVVLGPALGADNSPSLELIKLMLEGQIKAVPNMMTGIVDVRDVADLHLRAMTDPAARGERFLALSGEFLSMKEIADTVRSIGPAGARAPQKVAPNWLVRLAALFSANARRVAGPDLGRYRSATSEKAQRLLGWKPRSTRQTIIGTARSLVEQGLVKS